MTMLCPPKAVPLLALLFLAANAQTPSCKVIRKDVVVVGAGFSGLAAGKTLKDAGLQSFVILESTNRVGGRVKSNTGFGSGGNITIEECANWVFPGTPIFDLVKRYSLDITFQDFFNYDVYEYNQSATVNDPDYNASLIPKRTVNGRRQAFRRDAMRCLSRASAEFFKPNGNPPDYIAALEYLKKECNWEIEDNQDFFNHWYYIQFEMADNDTTVSEAFDPYARDDAYLMVDQGGFDQVARRFAEDNSLSPHIVFEQRVTAIKYNETGAYAARVSVPANNQNPSCKEYLAKRVILTVPAGVLNNNLIKFVPQLRYNELDYNPFKVGDYIKVFYEFKENFWGSTLKTEFLVSLQQNDNIGKCHHWQNLEADINQNPRLGTSTRFVPGSKTLFCTLTRPAFRALLNETGLKVLTHTQLNQLLEPLRRVFGKAVVDANFKSVFYPKHNLNVDYGYGSYSNWAPGYSQDDYFKFYGLGTAGYCEHNGCNKDPTAAGAKWILHISGTCSCYEHWEFVQGGYYSGVRSANLVLHDLRYIDAVPTSECEDFFRHWTPT